MENIDFNNIEFAIIIQCSIAKRRCSGFYCIQSFYDKNGTYLEILFNSSKNIFSIIYLPHNKDFPFASWNIMNKF